TVTSNGETIPQDQMQLSLTDGTFKLIDKYVPLPSGDTPPSQAQTTQSRIPWGIPIEYTVIPVLNSSDKLNKDGKLQSRTSLREDLPYSSLDDISKKGSTFGYGLNIRASKSESSKKVTVTWDLPYGNQIGESTIRPVVYRREAGTTAEINDGNVTVRTITDSGAKTAIAQCQTQNEKTRPYEYVVKYLNVSSPDVNQNTPFVPEYVEYCKTVMDTVYSPTEAKNVGYPFDIPGFTAENVSDNGTDEGFSEAVTWEEWDYSKRKVGPADDGSTPAYTVWTKNKNNAAGWFQIASINQNGAITTAADPGWYDTTITEIHKGLKLTPKNVSDSSGANNGLLKVQRDYKHYYMIRAQRKNSEGKTVYTYIGLDENTWTYRRISPEELAKAALLIVADATHVTGPTGATATSSNTKTIQGAYGSFSITEKYNAAVRYEFKYNCNSYIHKFTNCPAGTEINSFLRLKTTSQGTGVSNDNKVYYFDTSTSSVEGADDITKNLKSYNGTITFSAGKYVSTFAFGANGSPHYILSGSSTINEVKYDLPNVNENQTQFESWFPFLLGKNLKDQDRSSYDTDYPCCNNEWWHARTGGTITTDFVEEKE
ncbi:MAG: hypothetical protein J6Y69_00495, partial [Treponema sp.]|nr:hypothetical protein [Treponema sp.]